MLISRIYAALRTLFCDVVVIQRELLPGKLPPVLENLICYLNKRVVFDFDDAIYKYRKANLDERRLWIYKLCEEKDNIPKIIQRCSHIIAGNQNLANYARSLNSNVTIIPTPVDINYYTPKSVHYSKKEKIVIGWIGTSGNLDYVEQLSDILLTLQKKYNCIFKIVCNSISHNFTLKGIEYTWINWSVDSEKAALEDFDIGIMPLVDNAWTRGKCGFKILQYMACGIPVVASPVGANIEIIQDGVNGFLANSSEEWIRKLEKLINDDSYRHFLGQNGRKSVEAKYSTDMTYPKLAQILINLIETKSNT